MIGGADATEQQALLQVAEVEIRKEWSELRMPGSLDACSSSSDAVRDDREGGDEIVAVPVVVWGREGWCQWEWVCGREREGGVEKLLALRESLRVRRGARLLARRRREAGQVGHARHQLDPPRAHVVHVLQELRLVPGHL